VDLSEAIEGRRSIRKFKEDPVPKEKLIDILEAAILAPSGKNKQPWKFYIIQGEKRSEMIQAMKRGMDRLSKMGINTGSAKLMLRVMVIH